MQYNLRYISYKDIGVYTYYLITILVNSFFSTFDINKKKKILYFGLMIINSWQIFLSFNLFAL